MSVLNQLYREISTNSPQTLSMPIPDELGIGQISQTTTRTGTVISDWHMNYYNTMHVNGKSNDDFYQIIFCLNEGVSWGIENSKHVVNIQKGESCIYRGHGSTEYMRYREKSDFRFKSIKIPYLCFEEIIADYFDGSEADIYRKKLAEGFLNIKTTPYMEHVLAEIKDFTKYRGGLGHLYLDSKVHELLAVYLSEVLEVNIFKSNSLEISRTDRDAIMEAKRIIDDQIAYAPSCLELAKSVNVSKSKLERGFSVMFGTSVHSYIITQRLEKAAALLLQTDLCINEIASLVGYSKPSNFAAAFKRKYGILPRDYKDEKKPGIS